MLFLIELIITSNDLEYFGFTSKQLLNASYIPFNLGLFNTFLVFELIVLLLSIFSFNTNILFLFDSNSLVLLLNSLFKVPLLILTLLKKLLSSSILSDYANYLPRRFLIISFPLGVRTDSG